MPWEERAVKTMREDFIREVAEHKKSKSALCREYGISRPTGDKWIERSLKGEGLEDQSRAPRNRPRRVDAVMEEQIVAKREQYPAIGAVKLQRIMSNEGVEGLPCAKTFNNIFHRHGLITAQASKAATPYQRFEKEAPNEMWQGDYKGHFALGNGKRCHPLNIIDDYSRFNLCCEALLSETLGEMQPVMQRVFEEYGLPVSFLCDNGNPWGSAKSPGYTSFEVWMMELGVLTLHGSVHHPQTQGKDESYNRSFTKECLSGQQFADEQEAQTVFTKYRGFYNNQRPHHALQLEVPASRYVASPRMPRVIEDWEYGSEYQLRKVDKAGYITFRGQGYYLSEGFVGKTIAVRESHLPGQITLVFRQFRIARIDPEARVFTLKRAYLLQGDPRYTEPQKPIR